MLRRWTPSILIAMLLTCTFAVAGVETARAEVGDRLQQKREAIDEMASMTMDRLLAESPQAKRFFEKSVGYAVFDNFKVAVLVSGGGGVGVAVERSSRARTYMKMGTAGVGLGLGGQSYSVVLLFEDHETFRNFVEKGWQADATAAAAVGTKGAAAEASFSHGVAVYQLTNAGVMANIDLSGTKYWKHKKLNAVRVEAQAAAPSQTRQQQSARAPGTTSTTKR